MQKTAWQIWEIDILKEKYETLTAEQIQKDFLPHRTCNAIRIAITRNGLSQQTPKATHIKTFENANLPWSENEIKLLTDHYYDTTVVKLQQQYLPQRSIKAIERRAARMGLVRNSPHAGRQNTKPYTKSKPHARWSDKELELLERYKDSLSAQKLHDAYLPDKTPRQIRTKIRNESIRDYTDLTWTDEEIKILTDNAGKILPHEIAKMLPNRTIAALKNKAERLGLSTRVETPAAGWTEQETDLLMNHYGKMTVPEIQASYLPNRTLSACQNKITKLRLAGLLK